MHSGQQTREAWEKALSGIKEADKEVYIKDMNVAEFKALMAGILNTHDGYVRQTSGLGYWHETPRG